jgi:hypothetical protein
MSTLVEKRHFMRTPCKGFSCNVKTGVTDYELPVLNISNGGMLLKESGTESGLKEDDSYTFYFTSDKDKKTSKKGKVIRCQEKTIAVKFSTPFDLSKIRCLKSVG